MKKSVILAAVLTLFAATTAMAGVRQVWLAALVLLVIGFSQIIFTASCNTTLQLGAPGELRGRLMSLYSLVFAGITPFGAIFVGSMAEVFGTSAAYGAGGGLGLVCVLLLSARWRYRASPGG